MIDPCEILLVEDDPSDAALVRELFRQLDDSTCRLNIVTDGQQALAFLRQEGNFSASERPHLILLDLNLPKLNGFEVLRTIRADDRLRLIPVIILTTSNAEKDAFFCYSLGANAFITKPTDVQDFETVVQLIQDFWLTAVKLPPRYMPAKSPGEVLDMLREYVR